MNERGSHGFVPAFDPGGPPKPDIPYDPKAIATALDGLRLAIWKHKIRHVPENLFDLPNEVHRAWNTFSKSWPDRRKLRTDYQTESVKLLISMYDLQDLVSVDKINTIQDLFDFLYEITKDYILDPLSEILGEAFNRFCRTDADREQMLKEVLQEIGFKNVTIKFNAEVAPRLAVENTQGKLKPAWKDQKSKYDNPYEFLKAIYPEEIGPRLSWPRIYQLNDTQLYHALKRHAERGKLPEGVHILSRTEVTDRKHAAFDPEQVREAVNLSSAVRKRKWRANRQP